jgi:hypothetical protein
VSLLCICGMDAVGFCASSNLCHDSYRAKLADENELKLHQYFDVLVGCTTPQLVSRPLWSLCVQS